MRDTEFFQRAIGLEEPWRVKEVKLEVGAKKVEVEVECAEKTLWRNQAGERLHIHDWERRSWRHLDTMQFETRINALVPRVKHPDGHTETVRVPWAEARSRWTELFESVAIEVLLAARSVSQACELLRIDWSSAQRMMERAVTRGLGRRSHEGIKRVGLDEKSFLARPGLHFGLERSGRQEPGLGSDSWQRHGQRAAALAEHPGGESAKKWKRRRWT